jgi:hypothetical protein
MALLIRDPSTERSHPLRFSEPKVRFLLESTRPEALVARDFVNATYAVFPDREGRLASSILSEDDRTHEGALDELYVFSRLCAASYEVRYEEEGKGPDFRCYASGQLVLGVEVASFLDDVDRDLVAKRRGDHNRLGFALQLVTVRCLGTFLADPLDVPTEVVDYLAGQLGIPDASCVKAYLEREKTRFEHQWELAREYGWRNFADAEEELARWVDDRAWITGEGPQTLFDASIAWLRERRVLLPAASTIARLVGRVGEEAMQRFWDTLAAIPTPVQARQLEGLLEVPHGSRVSDLDRLRKGPVIASGKSMAAALHRLAEIAGLGFGSLVLVAIPRRRLVELARYGMAGKATLLRRHPRNRKLATLLATIVHLQARATDDALELLDFLMTHELLAKAHRQSREETVRRYPEVSRDAGKLAAAMAVLLKVTDAGAPISLEEIWRAIEEVVPRTDLRAAVDNLRQVVPAPNEDPNAEWRGALVQRYGVIRRFLPQLVATIEFGATAEAGPLLEAFRALSVLLETRPTVDVPAGHLDAEKVVVDLVPPAWRRIVFPPGRPEGTVHRAGYLFCVLEQFHQRLCHRDIFAPASSRWADPRAQLPAGPAWEAAKGPVLNTLQLPEEPTGLLAEHARHLDAALRDVGSRLGSHVHASVDEQGRLHASALAAIPDPASLVDLRNRTQAMMPRVDIGELVLEVMSWEPGIVGAFTSVSGGESLGRSPRPGPAAVPRPEGRPARGLPRGDGGPAGSAGAGAELRRAVEHGVPRRRHHQAPCGGLSGA